MTSHEITIMSIAIIAAACRRARGLCTGGRSIGGDCSSGGSGGSGGSGDRNTTTTTTTNNNNNNDPIAIAVTARPFPRVAEALVDALVAAFHRSTSPGSSTSRRRSLSLGARERNQKQGEGLGP